MQRGELRCMRRDVSTGKAEPVPAAFWTKHLVHYDGWGAVQIYRRRAGEQRGWGMFSNRSEDRVDGHAYFVSRSGFDRLYPVAGAPRQHEAEAARPRSRLQAAIREIADELHPNGFEDIYTVDLIAEIAPKLEMRGLPVRSRQTFERALGRRR